MLSSSLLLVIAFVLCALSLKAGVTDGCSRTVGNLLYTVRYVLHLCSCMQQYSLKCINSIVLNSFFVCLLFCFMWQVATKYPGNALPHRPTLLQYVVSSKVCSIDCCCVAVLFSIEGLACNVILNINWLFISCFNMIPCYLLSLWLSKLIVTFAAFCWFGRVFTLESFSWSPGLSLQVKTTAQLDAALSFLAATGSENLDFNKFEEACGVGMIQNFSLIYKIDLKLVVLVGDGRKNSTVM